MTFDGWDAQYYGDCLTYGQDSLMHFRTKGSKNGVRRYQTADGTWTDLGLRERRLREGFGSGREARAERRAARREARMERRAAKAAIRSANFERARQYKAEQDEIRRKRNPKNLTDEELNRGIERLKKEQEYRDLNTPAIVKTGKRIVENYFKAMEDRAAREERRYKMQTERANALAKYKEAQAHKTEARTEFMENLRTGGSAKRLEAKSKLIETKAKFTASGAIKKSINRIIDKEGANLVREMKDTSYLKSGAQHVKSGAKKAARAVRNEYFQYKYNLNSVKRKARGPSLN